MYRIVLVVGSGGFIGSVARYLTQQVISKYNTGVYPLGTFFANILGCLCIGLVYGFSEKGNWLSSEWRFFLATGICGGYTTFSAFSYESIILLKSENYSVLFLYIVLSVSLGIAATFLGVFLTK